MDQLLCDMYHANKIAMDSVRVWRYFFLFHKYPGLLHGPKKGYRYVHNGDSTVSGITESIPCVTKARSPQPGNFQDRV